ncbi:MAG: LLM class flavin-dependent oxidoreductase [Anaerolineae bacterium]
MNELARPVGIGFAGRGEVEDVVRWAQDAQRRGVDSVWLHDSLYERDAVTYCAAIASQVKDIRVALGALSPFTRTPALIAMTVSAMDEMAPERIILGLGTGLPLRLAQLGIPYTPALGVERMSQSIDMIRTLWSGTRIPSMTAGLPPIQPMFPPVHHVPIYIAAYRTPMLELAGQKADGYLARPLESIPNLKRLLGRLRDASVAAGRPADAVTTAGYLLTLVDETRREALNRAKREPFVIYMIGVLSNFAIEKAGFDKELRDRIFAAWRNEDYHTAAQLIPDEMLDTFILCGTREDVAAGAQRFHEAGLNIPILQPILQEDAQVSKLLDAAALYGQVQETAAQRAAAPDAIDLDRPAGSTLDSDRQLGLGSRVWRRLAAWYEITRPFSLTASMVPVAAAGAIAIENGVFNWSLFLLSFIGGVLLQIGTNITNEIYDVRNGIDTITSPRASHALLKGRVQEREAFILVATAFGLATLIGLFLLLTRGWFVVVIGVVALIAGWAYTAPPLHYKYRAMGVPLVFFLMGPLMVSAAYYVITGGWSWGALVVSVPAGLLVASILHGNEWRDIGDDARVGIGTLSSLMGRRAAHLGYVTLVVGAYLALALAVLFQLLPTTSLLAMLSMPLLVRAIRASELGSIGQQRAIAMIDVHTAQLYAVFGLLLTVGIALGRLFQ